MTAMECNASDNRMPTDDLSVDPSMPSATPHAYSTLADLVESNELQGALLATADGLPIVHIVRAPRSEAKLSAMTSALLGLCEAAAVESQIGVFSEVIIEARMGRLVAMPVTCSGVAAVLLVVSDMHTPLGKVLWAARAAAQRISN